MARTDRPREIVLVAPEAAVDRWKDRLSGYFLVFEYRQAEQLRTRVRSSVACVAIFDEGFSAPEWYALGIAAGVGKPIVVISQQAQTVAHEWLRAGRLRFLDADAHARDVATAIESLLRPEAAAKRGSYGARSDWSALLARSQSAAGSRLLDVVIEAVTASGATVEAQPKIPGHGIPDLAFWVPDLPASSNPVILELKTSISGDPAAAVRQLAEYARAVSAPIGILLYEHGPDRLRVAEPDVVALPARAFVARLAREPIGRIVAAELLAKRQQAP